MNDLNTRKYPRSMREAFGPYTDHNLEPMAEYRDKYRHADIALYIVLLAALILMAIIL